MAACQEAPPREHDFAFSGLIACANCGCSVVGEIKKQRYVYYHCTGYADKCQGNPASCRRRYVREEVLEHNSPRCSVGSSSTMRCSLGCAKPCTSVTPTSGGSRKKRSRGCAPNTIGYSARLDAMYVDKLDGRVDALSSRRCRPSGALSRIAAGAKSTAIKRPTSPTWTTACRFSNWRVTPKACSNGRSRAKNAVSQFRAIELHLGGRRGRRHFPPTLRFLGENYRR